VNLQTRANAQTSKLKSSITKPLST